MLYKKVHLCFHRRKKKLVRKTENNDYSACKIYVEGEKI